MCLLFFLKNTIIASKFIQYSKMSVIIKVAFEYNFSQIKLKTLIVGLSLIQVTVIWGKQC